MKALKTVLKDKETVIVDDLDKYDLFKSYLPKNVTIVKSQTEADKILKKDELSQDTPLCVDVVAIKLVVITINKA